MIVFNIIILDLKGNTGIAAYGIIANLSLVVTAVYSGLAQGMQPLVSHFYGMGNKPQTRMVLRYAMVYPFVEAVVMLFGLWADKRYRSLLLFT